MNTGPMYLGIDLGTSGVKVVLADATQSILASATAALAVSRPASGQVEQNPDDWITATRAAIGEIRAGFQNELLAVKAIGLSGQMHGATLLDQADRVLRPCILWNDTRSHREADALDRMPAFRQLTGNVVFPGFTAPKLRWIQQHEPECFRQTAMVLLPKDYLRLWLTGEHVSDLSDASGTSWLEVGRRQWSEELLAACDLDLRQVPALVEGAEPSGVIRASIAEELGLNPQAIVAGGAGDNAAAAVATGTVEAGSAFLSIGTSGVLFAANDRFLPRPESAVHAFCHALPGRWHQMGVILSASAALNWFSNLVGSSAAELTAELGSTLQAPREALFLPYLAGERTPHNDARVRAAFHGLGGEMDRRALTQAVLEGVAFAFRDNLEALKEAGTRLSSVVALGGGSHSAYWVQAIATALNLPVELLEQGDYGAACGAVRLAMLADELAAPDSICAMPPRASVTLPDATLQPAFEAAYDHYKQAYNHASLKQPEQLS